MTVLTTRTPAALPVIRTTRRAVCPYCGVGCVISAVIEEGRIVQIGADKSMAPNFGMLCQKGAMLSSPAIWDTSKRLQHPMIREKRDQAPRQVTWEEALTFIAGRLKAIRNSHGADSIAFYGSGQCDTEASYLFSKLFKGYLGTNNTDSNSRLCMSSAVAAYTLALGSDGPPTCYDDIFHADVILIIGANMAVNHPVLFNMIARRRAASPGLKVIVADPRKTRTADLADLHLPIHAGSDVALVQLIARGLLLNGRLDESFIQRSTEGFSAYRSQLMMLDEAALLATCGLEAQTIQTIVDWLPEPARLLSFYCQGANQSSRGVDKNLAIINLHLQLGQIGKPGAGPFSLTGQPNAMGGREVGYLSHQLPGYRLVATAAHRQDMERMWRIAPGSISAKPGLSAVRLFEQAAAGNIRALWTACTNPVVSMPNSGQIKQAMGKLDLLIHQDCYHPTETGLFADVLLPAAQWGEKTGTMTNSERLVSRSQKMFDPPGEAMPDWWIAAAVGRAMGFTGFDYVTAEQVWDEIRHSTAGRPCDMKGITNARLAIGPVRWPCPDEGSGGVHRRYMDGLFHTDSGRARFTTPASLPPDEVPSPDFPLGLTTGRIASQWHTRTRTGLVEELNRQEPEPFVEIHPGDAARFGVVDTQWIRMTSRRGSAVGRARVTETIRMGLLFMPFHWGELFAEGTSINAATSPAIDSISGQPELKFCAVKIEPLPCAPALVPMSASRQGALS